MPVGKTAILHQCFLTYLATLLSIEVFGCRSPKEREIGSQKKYMIRTPRSSECGGRE